MVKLSPLWPYTNSYYENINTFKSKRDLRREGTKLTNEKTYVNKILVTSKPTQRTLNVFGYNYFQRNT